MGNRVPFAITNRLRLAVGWQEVISGRWYGSDLLERWLNIMTVLLCRVKTHLTFDAHGNRFGNLVQLAEQAAVNR